MGAHNAARGSPRTHRPPQPLRRRRPQHGSASPHRAALARARPAPPRRPIGPSAGPMCGSGGVAGAGSAERPRYGRRSPHRPLNPARPTDPARPTEPSPPAEPCTAGCPSPLRPLTPAPPPMFHRTAACVPAPLSPPHSRLCRPSRLAVSARPARSGPYRWARAKLPLRWGPCAAPAEHLEGSGPFPAQTDVVPAPASSGHLCAVPLHCFHKELKPLKRRKQQKAELCSQMPVLLASSYPKPMKCALQRERREKILIYGCGANSSLGDFGPRLWLPLSCQIPPGHAPNTTSEAQQKQKRECREGVRGTLESPDVTVLPKYRALAVVQAAPKLQRAVRCHLPWMASSHHDRLLVASPTPLCLAPSNIRQ